MVCHHRWRMKGMPTKQAVNRTQAGNTCRRCRAIYCEWTLTLSCSSFSWSFCNPRFLCPRELLCSQHQWAIWAAWRYKGCYFKKKQDPAWLWRSCLKPSLAAQDMIPGPDMENFILWYFLRRFLNDLCGCLWQLNKANVNSIIYM